MGRTCIISIDSDQHGYMLVRPVDVAVEWTRHVDQSYGEDADGNRGTMLVEFEVLNCWVCPDQHVDPELSRWACAEAEAIFYNYPEKYAA